MDRIFTPWRLPYLTTDREQEQCVFCAAVAADSDTKAFVLHRGTAAFVILNIYPYSNGHVMVVPNRHLSSLGDATPEERREIMELATVCEQALLSAYRADGINLGINMGEAAGAGIVGHIHVHVLPRWKGDTSFTTVIGNTRFVPEALHQTYERLAPLFAGHE